MTPTSDPSVSGYAPVHGLQLYYEIHHETESAHPPLVLLHGGGSTIDTSFAKSIPLFSKNRRVIAFDQQGHGRTADVDRPFSFEQSADDTVALLEHLKIGQADFLGYSNGGHIALEIAIRHPEKVRKQIILSAMLDRAGTDPGFWEGFPKATPEVMPPELKEAYLRVSPHPERFNEYFAKGVARMMHFQGWAPETLKAINAPTLLMAGDRDIVTVEHLMKIYRLFPNSEVAILPNTDHMNAVEQAAPLVLLTEAFLDR